MDNESSYFDTLSHHLLPTGIHSGIRKSTWHDEGNATFFRARKDQTPQLRQISERVEVRGFRRKCFLPLPEFLLPSLRPPRFTSCAILLRRYTAPHGQTTTPIGTRHPYTRTHHLALGEPVTTLLCPGCVDELSSFIHRVAKVVVWIVGFIRPEASGQNQEHSSRALSL